MGLIYKSGLLYSGKGGGSVSIEPTPSAGLTESTIVSTVNSATGTSTDVPSLFGVQKWTNTKTVRRIMDGSNVPSGTTMTTTGIGTWDDSATPVETDWWYDAAFVFTDSDNIDISIKFDPNGETIALGGYILDTTTGKICIKFANAISSVTTAKVAVDITYTRNEVV